MSSLTETRVTKVRRPSVRRRTLAAAAATLLLAPIALGVVQASFASDLKSWSGYGAIRVQLAPGQHVLYDDAVDPITEVGSLTVRGPQGATVHLSEVRSDLASLEAVPLLIPLGSTVPEYRFEAKSGGPYLISSGVARTTSPPLTTRFSLDPQTRHLHSLPLLLC
jgi:hypothetical protein